MKDKHKNNSLSTVKKINDTREAENNRVKRIMAERQRRADREEEVNSKAQEVFKTSNAQRSHAILHYTVTKKTEKVYIYNTGMFLDKYIPVIGTTAERKEIRKERKKITNAIGKCRIGTPSFVKYVSKLYYKGNNRVKIEIRMG